MVSFAEEIKGQLKSRLSASCPSRVVSAPEQEGPSVEDFLGSFDGLKSEAVEDIEKHSVGTFEERLALFARLERKRREFEKGVDFCKSEAERLSPRLQEEMAENGIDNMKVEGLSIFTKSNFYCSKKADKDGVTTEMICNVLRDLGMGHVVSEGYAASALKAKVKEWIDGEVAIPEQLAKLINYGTTTTLSTRL